MRQRDELDVAVKAVKAFEAGIRDNRELIEMGEAEGDATVVKDAEGAIDDLLDQSRKAQVETLLSGEADANDCYLEMTAKKPASNPRLSRLPATMPMAG